VQESLTMLLFFVGGIRPRIDRVLQSNYAPCLNCQHGTMDLVEMGKVLELFWLPVWTFSTQQLFHCNTCNFTAALENDEVLQENILGESRKLAGAACSQYGASISSGRNFCPKCGNGL
jgi:hypothetical protein